MNTKQYLAAAIGIIVVAILMGVQNIPGNFLSILPVNSSSWPDEFSFIEGLRMPSIEGEMAWETWQRYLEYAHAHDTEGVAKLAHNPSPVCQDPSMQAECYARLDYAYSAGSKFKEEDFTNVWSDENQIILSTDYKEIDDNASQRRGRFRSIIYFAKENGKEPKLIGFKPTEGAITSKDNLSESQIEAELDKLVQDTDKDGLTDVIETCTSEQAGSGCIPTDPYDPDTNNNGWWDGIEILINFNS